ncbi:MAG TPA: bifunctional ADP-heptose synthase [Myxococcota bacterium]|nr:bifunctional ADP-heptose synthase [Myxococcota bacterium]
MTEAGKASSFLSMNDLTEIISKFPDLRIVVLGDLVIDRYINGTTGRISREAPVLIVREESEDARLGGAGNVVANISAMGGHPLPVGLVGSDDAGSELTEMLATRGIPGESVMVDPNRFTTEKTRVLAGGKNTVRQQMLRIDRVNDGPVTQAIRDMLVERLIRALGEADAVVISDYGEGVVEGSVLDEVLKVIQAGAIPVFADARRGIERFMGAEVLTPNEPELAMATGIDVHKSSGLEKAGRRLLADARARTVLVKRGNNGMALFVPDCETQTLPVFGTAEVADVTGAGDTVIAAFALARTAGAEPADAMRLANMAGGIKVTKSGTAVVKAGELVAALQRKD